MGDGVVASVMIAPCAYERAWGGSGGHGRARGRIPVYVRLEALLRPTCSPG